MAVIAISRQVAACGDEIAASLAQKLHYRFIGRQMIEQKLVDLGFPEEKLKKYDEKKPGFFASLAKDRDEYLDYLQTAILESAVEGNCVLIGRGAFFILNEVPNLFAVRLVAKDDVRIKRLMDEFSWDEKQARQRIEESDNNRLGFHKSFFNLTNEDPALFHLALNTGIVDVETASYTIADVCQRVVTLEQEEKGGQKLQELLAAQRLVNALVFEHSLNINFLKAYISGDTVTLQGVANSSAQSEQAASIAARMMPDKRVVSSISVVQDFKSYP
ncbi:MAG: cytidylate kinase family protein [Spirochaetaceae bacterium]|jgi:cytidylate kinase|nr:cytidylate kinase family protein [Spirochaetaceae bacterium]